MTEFRLSRRQALLLTGAAALAPTPLWAQADDWPNKRPIRAIVPYGAGSSTDIIARAVLEEVGKGLGQSIVIENRAGASGTTGANAVAKSDPDGYTLLINASSHTVVPSTFTTLPYDTQKDFAAVAPIAAIPNVIVVNSGRNYTAVSDLVAAAKAKQGAMNYASAGVGSATHLAAERFRLAAGIAGQHVPFKGSSEALTEILADRIDFYASPVNAAIQLIKERKITALAVSSARRASALPDVPTTEEAGLKDSSYEFWIGAFLPRQTPRPIVDRLNAEMRKAIGAPVLVNRFKELGADPMPLTPSEFDDLIGREIVSNAALVKAAGIKAN